MPPDEFHDQCEICEDAPATLVYEVFTPDRHSGSGEGGKWPWLLCDAPLCLAGLHAEFADEEGVEISDKPYSVQPAYLTAEQAVA